MLALPLQRGENVDIATPMYSFLNAQFGDEGMSNFSGDVPVFQQLRDNAICILDPSDTGIQTIQRYSYHMGFIVPRLKDYDNDVKFTFNWFDGFRNSRKITSHSLFVDWACLLWNLAALESQRGAKIDRSTEEGVRNASKHFQQAAGIFEFIKKNLAKEFAGPVVSGLTDDGLHMATQLMLAQAQLCFYEKAVKDRKAGSMKPAVVAKLAVQTAQYYSTVRDVCYGSTLSAVIDASWSHHCDYQAKSFAAAGEYWQAQSVKESALAKGVGYGEEISRLQLAEKAMRAGLEAAHKNKLGTGLITSGDALLATIISNKAKAINENNTIYMDIVPDEAAVTPVVGISMVKATPMLEYYCTEKPLFKEVMPKSVRQLRGQLREELVSAQTKAQADCDVGLASGRQALNGMGLPAALETYRSGAKLPETLVAKILRVQEMGGRQELQSKIEELEAASKRALQTMATIDETLAREEKTDAQFRGRYPTWSGVPSSVLAADIRATNGRMREAYTAAKDSDAGIMREMNDPGFDTWTKTICNTIVNIESLLPLPPQPLLDFADVAGMDPAQANAQLLERKLHEMTVLIDNREKATARMKALVEADITEQLLAAVSGGNDPALVVESQRNLCNDIKSEIATSLTRQHALLGEIGAVNDTFQKSLVTDPTIAEKERILKELDLATTRYFNQHATITAGITFYSNLQARLSTLQQSSDDLCYSQQLLRQDYEVQYRQEKEQAAQREANQFAQLQASMTGPGPAVMPQGTQYQQQQPAPYISGYPQILSPPSGTGMGAYGQPQQMPFNAYNNPTQQQQQQQQPYGQTHPQQFYASQPGQHMSPQQQQQQPQPQPSSQQMFSPSAALSPGSSSSVLSPPAPSGSGMMPLQYGIPPGAAVGQPVNAQFMPPVTFSQPQGGYQAPQYGHIPPPPPSSHMPASNTVQSPQQNSQAETLAKAQRLSEMGFSQEACLSALATANGDENRALNILLGESPDPSPATATAGAAGTNNSAQGATQVPSKPAKPSGLFGKVWGKSSGSKEGTKEPSKN